MATGMFRKVTRSRNEKGYQKQDIATEKEYRESKEGKDSFGRNSCKFRIRRHSLNGRRNEEIDGSRIGCITRSGWELRWGSLKVWETLDVVSELYIQSVELCQFHSWKSRYTMWDYVSVLEKPLKNLTFTSWKHAHATKMEQNEHMNIE